ncbi:hypothetical protein BBK14_24240 [Parafrankia soli]|uniref:Uncharacterized protein n=1 Tax=Parafrankia soli TaxID=2599596 RepID=A0A1S1PPI8_9ACTN|nr:hypothetical protein [Parafrankia soli]OHV23236.1 hypothetical protein BBK14_24240 [Parafrankia soli]
MHVGRCGARFTGLAHRLASAVLPGLAFAVPTVALALLAHLPTAHTEAPAPAGVALSVAAIVALCAGSDLARSAHSAGAGRPGPPGGTSLKGLLCAPGSGPGGALASPGQLAAALAGRPLGAPPTTDSGGLAAAAARLSQYGVHSHGLYGQGLQGHGLQGHGIAVLLAHALAAAAASWWTSRGCQVLRAACLTLGSCLSALRAPVALVPVPRRIVRAPRLHALRALDRPWAATPSRGPPAIASC